MKGKDILDLGIKGFSNTFDESFVYSESEKAKIFINNLDLEIGVFTKKPRKHYKKARVYNLIYESHPQFIVCVNKKCEHISECWDLKTGKLKIPNKFKPNICAFLKPKKKTFKPLKSRRLSKLSDFEKNLIIVLLKSLNIKGRETQIKELINKFEYSDLISL